MLQSCFAVLNIHVSLFFGATLEKQIGYKQEVTKLVTRACFSLKAKFFFKS